MYVLLCTILLLKVHFYTFFLSKSPSDHIRKKESRTGGKKEQSVLRSLRKQRKTSFAIRNRRRHSIAAALLGSMIANKNKLMQFTLLSKAITREFPKPPGHGDSKWNAKTQLSSTISSSSSEIRWKGCSSLCFDMNVRFQTLRLPSGSYWMPWNQSQRNRYVVLGTFCEKNGILIEFGGNWQNLWSKAHESQEKRAKL